MRIELTIRGHKCFELRARSRPQVILIWSRARICAATREHEAALHFSLQGTVPYDSRRAPADPCVFFSCPVQLCVTMPGEILVPVERAWVVVALSAA